MRFYINIKTITGLSVNFYYYVPTGIELTTLLKSCLSQLLCHVELWLIVAQRKLFNEIPHNFEKHCRTCGSGPLLHVVRVLVPFLGVGGQWVN
jgi:hypothetical protein